MECRKASVNTNVTHRLCTHRLQPRRWQPMPIDIRIRFGRAIRRIREEQNINQEEAAERCRAAPDVLQRYRAGSQNVSLVNIERVAKGLRISLPKLFERV